jgi:hypothetical protein
VEQGLVAGFVRLEKVVLMIISFVLLSTTISGKIPFGVPKRGVLAREISSNFLFLRKGTSLSEPESSVGRETTYSNLPLV